MADWFVGPIIDKINNACSDYLQDQYRWQTGMKEELQRLRENYPKVQAVVSASNQAQIKDRNPELNSWIWQLRDAIDEANDVLDDFEYVKLEEQLELNKEETEVRSSFNKFFLKLVRILCRVCERALEIDPNLGRLEAVVKKLDKVSAEVTTFLHLIENAKQEQQVLDLQLSKDRETGPLPKTGVIGRDKEKYYIKQWLRKPTNIASPTLYKNISVLSIVAHGGMGKTALLQDIYEDLKEEFELDMWVCVSNHFDAKKVIADMLEYLKMERPPLESPLATVQKRLKDVVKSKRFLLVLDDIWEEEDMSKWENALSPLVYGGLGSKILLTTRMDTVASAIAKVVGKDKEIYPLKGLDDVVCLKLLMTHAFAGVKNVGAHTILIDIAVLIVKKLSGCPMTAKAIGVVLSSSLTESHWNSILNTQILDVKSESGGNNILPILRLSFMVLSQPLQNCFAFCGIFPQDHSFDKDDLVRMWIALGFIQESSIEGETLEDIGGRYFDALARKSFFDQFQYNEIIYYKMHDLLHDLAQSISSEESFRFVGDNILSFKIPKNVRHLFVETENLEVLRKIKDVKHLHSLFLTFTTNDRGFTEILTKIFKASTNIRLLFIYSPWQKKMSEAIQNLRHLRYLNLYVGLTQMPRSLSSLYHLQFILHNKVVRGSCSDDFLPNDVSNLSNLRHLELPRYVSVPGIGKLRSLQELNEFNVKNENGYRIGELEHMNELHKLKIHFLENVKDAIEARNAKLFEKKKLRDLFLNWGNTVDDEQESHRRVGSLRNIINSDLDVSVLENLQPYKNLKRLSIVSYEGTSSAKWMYNADLISHLEYIRLNKCSEWETLPPFGQLRHLKSLYLCNMRKAKRLDYKFHGNDKVSVFPSLEVLYIKRLKVLEDWFDGAGAAAYDRFFPCLTELILDNCPKLQELPYLPPMLKKMKIQNIGWKGALNFKKGTSKRGGTSKSIPLQTLEVRSCPNITSLLLADVSKLTIEDCPNLISLDRLQQVESSAEKSLQSLPSSSSKRLSSLKILRLKNVPKLKSLPDLPSSLYDLFLYKLDNLQCLPSSLSAISSLEELYLDRIPLLKSLPELPPSLNSLSLSSLDNLECLPSSLSAISSLKELVLDSIPLLKALPELPPSLSRLNIYRLRKLRCLPSSLSAISSLKELDLDSIPRLKSLPELPPSLYNLSLRSLYNLECLPSSLSAISSLKRLFLCNIPLLKSLPELPTSLASIIIRECHPAFAKRYKKIFGSDWHKVAHIPNVRIL